MRVLNECCNFKIWIFEYIRIISGIRIVLTGFEYYFRIRIFIYSTTALLLMIWDELPQEAIRYMIVSFCKRLRACNNAKGEHFEYKLQNSLVNLVVDIFVFNH